MIDRFTVRKAEHGFGVWDAGTSGWRSERTLQLAEAEKRAEMMNEQERAAKTASAPTTTSRSLRQNPPKPCQVYLDGAWRIGYLTEWQHINGTWFGAGTCNDPQWNGWIPADRLRPLT